MPSGTRAGRYPKAPSGLDRIGPGDEITIDLLLEIHSRLLAGTRLQDHGEHFRTVQNWIGGSDYDPARPTSVRRGCGWVRAPCRRIAGAPDLTVESAAALIGRTYNPANEAVERLVQAGILRQITGKRNRVYEAPEIIDAFADLERQLAGPSGDTHASRPARLVPRRPSSTPRSRTSQLGERILAEHAGALETLADHDPDE